jgi:hypothetical protein
MPLIARCARSAGLLFVLAACRTTMLQSPATTPPRPVPRPMTATHNASGSIRTVCRGTSVPGYWAITDYVASPLCESKGSLTFNAMVIEDLSLYSIGSAVLICANQRQPADWDFTGNAVGVTNQCPREPTNKSSSPTVVEIVKRRGAD